MTRVRLEVRGEVQGVGFRWYARDAARRLSLAGWVRNREDGSVEIAVEGDEAAVLQFIAHVERGPRGARVDHVDRRPLSDERVLDAPFVILH